MGSEKSAGEKGCEGPALLELESSEVLVIDGPDGLSPGDPTATVVRATIAAGLRGLREHQADAERGGTEGVHKMRTTARRLRSALRTFRPLLDGAWARGLANELKWLAGRLGALRDLDVQRDRLRAGSEDLGDALAPFFAVMDQQHEAALTALNQALRSDRTSDLLRRLAEAAREPVTTDLAQESCRTALPPLVASTWKTLKQAGRTLQADDPDESYHEARILAKRARYAAESVAPALGSRGKEAERFARRATAVQDILGEHQDAVVARDLLESAAAGHPTDGPFNLAIGRMVERQAHAATEARARFVVAWGRLDRKHVRRWLK